MLPAIFDLVEFISNLLGGELVFSDKGLGVRCSCHGYQMSVAKFSEVKLSGSVLLFVKCSYHIKPLIAS